MDPDLFLWLWTMHLCGVLATLMNRLTTLMNCLTHNMTEGLQPRSSYDLLSALAVEVWNISRSDPMASSYVLGVSWRQVPQILLIYIPSKHSLPVWVCQVSLVTHSTIWSSSTSGVLTKMSEKYLFILPDAYGSSCRWWAHRRPTFFFCY